MNYPRILVISNNSFSLSNANGRTLGLLFQGWPKDRLAQFCLSTDGPNWDICDNYYCISDVDALKSLFHIHGARRNDLRRYNGTVHNGVGNRTIKRTAFSSLIRHIVWLSGCWKGHVFDQWIESVDPEIVMIQSGDTAFTHIIARRISKQFHARLVFFNTEGIFFLKNNYLYKGFGDCIFFPLYRTIYNKAYRKSMESASYAFYLHDMIQRDNDSVFSVPSEVIYTSTSFKPSEKEFDKNNPVFSYFGTFSYGRAKVLVEVARYLTEIDLSYRLNVYGKASSEDLSILKSFGGIDYKGFVSYDQVVKEINKSDILLHVETQDPYYAENLMYGFSTKIADSLASGRSFVLYSSPSIACASYLIKNDCAWVAYDKASFISAIKSIISDSDARERVIKRAKVVASLNHDIDKNKEKFQRSLLSLFDKVNDVGVVQ